MRELIDYRTEHPSTQTLLTVIACSLGMKPPQKVNRNYDQKESNAMDLSTNLGVTKLDEKTFDNYMDILNSKTDY